MGAAPSAPAPSAPAHLAHAGTFSARVSTSSAPTGLIQAFSDDVNFGAMVFNDSGAGSECKHEDPALKNEGIGDGEIACIKRCKNGSTETAQQCHRDAGGHRQRAEEGGSRRVTLTLNTRHLVARPTTCPPPRKVGHQWILTISASPPNSSAVTSVETAVGNWSGRPRARLIAER